MRYDVVVVGGRIGGSVSSLFASKGGLDVLMIEKQQEIGTPVQCAEGTSLGTFKTLQMEPSPKYVCTEIEGVYVHSPDNTRINIKMDSDEGFVLEKKVILERKIFDKHLAIESARAGTDIMVKTTVKDLIIKKGKVCGVVAKHLGQTMDIQADVVIAADGLESNIARKAGINNYQTPHDVCSCAQYEMVGVDVDPHHLEVYMGEETAPGGYAWIFPKGEDVANVGIGVRSSAETAYNYLKKFASKLDATPVELNVGGVPLYGITDKTFTDGLLVVGDAARQIEPATGGGIHITAECARIAGEVAVEAVQNENTSSEFLEKYETLWKAAVGPKLEDSLKYRKIIDALTDEELNALAKFLNEEKVEDINSLGSISKLSILKLIKNHPNLLRLLKELI
jgi:digeranylgeranylglycerophospholipid reductase